VFRRSLENVSLWSSSDWHHITPHSPLERR